MVVLKACLGFGWDIGDLVGSDVDADSYFLRFWFLVFGPDWSVEVAFGIDFDPSLWSWKPGPCKAKARDDFRLCAFVAETCGGASSWRLILLNELMTGIKSS